MKSSVYCIYYNPGDVSLIVTPSLHYIQKAKKLVVYMLIIASETLSLTIWDPTRDGMCFSVWVPRDLRTIRLGLSLDAFALH